MTRVVEAEKEYKATPEKAIAKFFKKFPELEYWKETFEYMVENGESFFCDNRFANGEYNKDWAYALHLDINEDYTYICVIERA